MSARPRRLWFAVIAMALAGAAAAIALSASADRPARAPGAVQGKSPAARTLSGIPQHGVVLGSPTAPVTLVEFADIQCPYCGAFARDAMPSIIHDYVRTGRVRVVFEGLAFVGPDSDRALRAVLAASRQGRAWQMIAALYERQGAENTGWVTDGLLREVAHAVPGLDAGRLLVDSRRVDGQIRAAKAAARAAGVRGTPTFYAGRTGNRLRAVRLDSLTAQALMPSLDALLRE
jgi:protein-disulfide isomerase